MTVAKEYLHYASGQKSETSDDKKRRRSRCKYLFTSKRSDKTHSPFRGGKRDHIGVTVYLATHAVYIIASITKGNRAVGGRVIKDRGEATVGIDRDARRVGIDVTAGIHCK